MTRLGSALVAVGSAALVAVVAWAAIDEGRAPWRAHQQRYLALAREANGTGPAVDVRARPHEVTVPALGLVDRCTTCHLGMEPGARSFDEPALFRAHSAPELLERHPLASYGCTSCHGGQGRALDRESAHDRWASGGSGAFLAPAVRCARCHPAGIGGPSVLTRGVALYFEYGCSGCHQPGRPGTGIGPDLAAIGLRGSDYLRQVVLRPDEVYPQTIMPPLRHQIGESGEAIDALVAFLHTLEPWPAEVARVERRFDSRSCTGCHRGADATSEPSGPGHRCPYLHDEARWHTCAGCHRQREDRVVTGLAVPTVGSEPEADGRTEPAASGGEGEESRESLPELFRRQLERAARPVAVGDPLGRCPHIESAASACGVCHREGER